MNLPISPVAKRLEDAAKRADKSLKDLSLAAGRNHAYLQQFVKRGTPRVLPEDVRVTLAVELDADPDDFLDHSVKPTAPRIPGVTTASKLGRQKAGPRSGDELDAEIVQVPIYDAQASAGPGSLVEDGEPIGYYPMTLNMLRILTGAPIDQLAILEVRGDSMDPEFKDGDLIGIDRSSNRMTGELPYVVNYNDMVLVKKLSPDIETGRVDLISVNPQFPKRSVDSADQLNIIGEVIFQARLLRRRRGY